MGLVWVRISSLSSYLGKTLFPSGFKAHFAGCCIPGWQSLPINNLNISFNSLWAYMIFVEKLAKYRWLSIICDLRILLFLVFSLCPVLLAFWLKFALVKSVVLFEFFKIPESGYAYLSSLWKFSVIFQNRFSTGFAFVLKSLSHEYLFNYQHSITSFLYSLKSLPFYVCII